MTSEDIPHKVISDISYSDMADESGVRIVDCITGMIAHEKYPHNGKAPHELLNPEDVVELVRVGRIVIEKLYEKSR